MIRQNIIIYPEPEETKDGPSGTPAPTDTAGKKPKRPAKKEAGEKT